MSRMFTTCDVYSPNPRNPYDLNEQQFRTEIRRLAEARWGR
jgi:hypothetical protein